MIARVKVTISQLTPAISKGFFIPTLSGCLTPARHALTLFAVV